MERYGWQPEYNPSWIQFFDYWPKCNFDIEFRKPELQIGVIEPDGQGEQDAETWCDEIAEEQSAQKQSAALDRTRGRFFIRDCYR